MPVFTQINGNRILFLHIPKCGGTSIEKLFQKSGCSTSFLASNRLPELRVSPQHFCPATIEAILGKENFYYTFTVVRNPYDRIESEYRYRAHISKSKGLNPVGQFSQWIVSSIDKAESNASYLDNHFRRQTDFLATSAEIYRFEDGITNIAQNLSRKLNISLPENMYHERKNPRVPVEWSPLAREVFNQYYSADFRELNYHKIPARANFVGMLRAAPAARRYRRLFYRCYGLLESRRGRDAS
jgi:hypothetical protein